MEHRTDLETVSTAWKAVTLTFVLSVQKQDSIFRRSMQLSYRLIKWRDGQDFNLQPTA